MEKLTLGEICRAAACRYSGPPQLLQQPVKDIVTDSRAVNSGMLFAAIPGQHVDGHDYIPAALAAGAIAALGEKPMPRETGPYLLVDNTERALGDIARNYRRLFPAEVIGISGSVGKTSCKEMIASVLAQELVVLKTEGNFNNALGLPLTLFRLNHSHQVAVIEMGISDFGEMRYLAGIAGPNAAVLTNIGDAHLEQLHDRQGVLAAKTEMLELLPDGATVYLNGDDHLLAAFQPPARLHTIRFGLGENCEFRAERLHETADGLDLQINSVPLHVYAYGSYNAYSALAAFALGRAYGLSDAAIRNGVAAFSPPRGRGNIIRTPYLHIVDHSYNANPVSMRAALDSLHGKARRCIAVLGDMNELGENSADMHRELGRYAAQAGFSPLICIGEKARDICSGAQQAGADARWYPDIDAATAVLPDLLQKDDLVLVKASNSMKLGRIVEALQAFR